MTAPDLYARCETCGPYYTDEGGNTACVECGTIQEETMNIADLQKECFQLAKEKGWQEKPVPVPEQVALICSEACEGLEAYRENQPKSWTEPNGKPAGLGSEYADIMIRIGHYAELEGIDLEYEIRRKLDYNKTRPYRHGNKLA